MENIFEIQATKKTPLVKFDLHRGVLEIKGYSLPSNAIEFYSNLSIQIEQYIKDPLDITTVHLFFEYLNTSSSKTIFQLLNQFEKLMDMGKQIEVNWYASSDDIDMHDLGLQYQNSLKIPVNIIEVDM